MSIMTLHILHISKISGYNSFVDHCFYAFASNEPLKAFSFRVVRLPIRPCVRVWSYIKSFWTRYLLLQTACGNFTKFTDAVGDKDDMIRFWVRRVKGQGHNEAIYGQKITCSKMHLWTISCLSAISFFYWFTASYFC